MVPMPLITILCTPPLRRTAAKLAKFTSVLLLVGLFSAPFVRAQAISGDITGVVTDASKSVVVRAEVVATNQATGVVSTATTNAEGEFRLVNLPPGRYTVSATAQGFSKQVLKDYVVELN